MRRALASFAIASLTLSPAQAATELAFVSCPIVRDTKSVPCWLTEYQGQLYYLTIQTDVSAPLLPPELGHKVLVEGTVSNDPPICGGKVIKPVRLSVIQERSEECNTLLPAEDRYTLPFEPPRPPGPSKGRLAFDPPPPPPAPQPPFKARKFHIPYDFDMTIGARTGAPELTEAFTYAQQISARKVKITGYRGASKLTDGTVLAETTGIAERRAKQAAEMLRGAGLTSAQYEVTWEDKPQVGGPSSRRAEVVFSP